MVAEAAEAGGNGEVAGFTEHSPEVEIAGVPLTVPASGAFALKLSCPGGATSCSGTVTIKTLSAVASRSAHSAKAKQKKRKKTILTLAKGSFSIAGGKLLAVRLHLSTQAKKLLAKMHTVRARVTVLARNPQGATHTSTAIVTLKAAKKRRRH